MAEKKEFLNEQYQSCEEKVAKWLVKIDDEGNKVWVDLKLERKPAI